MLSPNLWSYIDAYDLADAIVLAMESELPGHEVFYIASPDNVGGRNLGEILHQYNGDKIELRPTSRPDASGISSEKAQRMLGWTPKRSWRDYLDAGSNQIFGVGEGGLAHPRMDYSPPRSPRPDNDIRSRMRPRQYCLVAKQNDYTKDGTYQSVHLLWAASAVRHYGESHPDAWVEP